MEGVVTVDPLLVVGATVPQLANPAPAAAIPGALEMGLEAIVPRRLGTDLGPGRGRQRQPVGIPEPAAIVVDRLALVVDQATDVVDRSAVVRPDWIPAGVHPRQPERMDAGAGGEGMAAEVKGVGLARLDGFGDDAADRPSEQAATDPRQEAAAGGVAGQRVKRLPDSIASRHQLSLASRLDRRRPAVATTLPSWARLLNVPFARTMPVESTARAYGLPGTSSSFHRSASATSSKISTARSGSPPRLEIAGANA